MRAIFEDMAAKQWTSEEVRELAQLAKRKGYSKSLLAELIGIHPASLSRWMAPDRTEELPMLSRNALSWIEFKIQQRDDLV